MQVMKERPLYYKKTKLKYWTQKCVCFMSLKLNKVVFIWSKIQQRIYTTIVLFYI